MAETGRTEKEAHAGGHGHAAPMVEKVTDFEVLEIALRELAIEKGLFTAEDHRRYTEHVEQLQPAAGSRFVAKAWLDPGFRQLALQDAIAACHEVGVDWLRPTGFGTPSDFTALEVLEDTPTLHHVIEDLLSREVYGTLPAPESQLVALAHSLIGRGVIDEHTLVARMAAVRARLEAAGDMTC